VECAVNTEFTETVIPVAAPSNNGVGGSNSAQGKDQFLLFSELCCVGAADPPSNRIPTEP